MDQLSYHTFRRIVHDLSLELHLQILYLNHHFNDLMKRCMIKKLSSNPVQAYLLMVAPKAKSIVHLYGDTWDKQMYICKLCLKTKRYAHNCNVDSNYAYCYDHEEQCYNFKKRYFPCCQEYIDCDDCAIFFL